MDLLTLFRLLGRHKIVVAVASLFTLTLMVGSYVMAPPVFRATGSIVLFSPPKPPDPDPAKPAEAVDGAENPYVRFNDITVVVDILVRVMQTSEVEQGLRDSGLSGTYTIGANLDFERGPIIDVAAEAGTSMKAKDSAKLVMNELGTQLQKLQTDQGTSVAYQIRGSTVVEPARATTVISSAIRRLIASGALGGMLVIGSALLADVRATRRRQRKSEGALGTDDQPVQPTAVERPRPLSLQRGAPLDVRSQPATHDRHLREPASDEAAPGAPSSPTSGAPAEEPEVEVDVPASDRREITAIHPYARAMHVAQEKGDIVDRLHSRRSS